MVVLCEKIDHCTLTFGPDLRVKQIIVPTAGRLPVFIFSILFFKH